MVLVEGRPELNDIHPLLKRLNHSQICVWHRAISSNASLNILCVSGAVLPSLQQNLMQIHCSVIVAGRHCGSLRIGCLEYLDLKGIGNRGVEKKYIMRSLMNCTPHPILFG